MISNWIEDIGNYLQTNNFGIVGSDIFYNKIPDTPLNCIVLISQAGEQTQYTLQKKSKLEKPHLGIRVRNVENKLADQKAQSIEELLDGIYNTNIGDNRFKRVRAIASHYLISQSDNNTIYSINFELQIG